MEKELTEEYTIEAVKLFNTIKPCPFCGAPAELRQNYNESINRFFYAFTCVECEAITKYTSSKIDIYSPKGAECIEGMQTIKKAIYRWNRRANE